MKRHAFTRLILTPALLASALFALGCSMKGDMGPQGAQGPAGPQITPTYYYNSNFDSQANLSEWTVYQSGGGGGITNYLDSTLFNSPSVAMSISITGSVAGDSFVYQPITFDLTKDIWAEFDWRIDSVVGQFEIVLNIGSKVRALVGYSSTLGLYLTENTINQYVLSSPGTTFWHHVKLKLDPITLKSSYWFDGYSLGENYSTNVTPSGTPPTGSFFGIRIQPSPGTKSTLDNLKIYRY